LGAHRPGGHRVNGVAFSLEEAVEKVKEAITHPRLVYCNHCGRSGTAMRTVQTYEMWDEKQREWVDAEYGREISLYHCGDCDSEEVTDETPRR
jgi:hypothetical protein